MTWSLRAATILVGTTLLACGGGNESADSATARDIHIALERNACFGRCPVYRLELSGTGKVTYEGRGFVKTTGRQEASVSAGDVQALAKEIEDAGYFEFRDNYPPDATDHATVVTTVRIGERTKRIEHNLGSRSAPAVLEALYQRIDETADVERWVGPRETAAPVKDAGRET